MRRCEVIQRLVKKHNWTRGAELGVWTGDTFFYLLKHCPNLHLIGVDNWVHYSAYPEKKDKDLGVGEYWPIEKTIEIGRKVREQAAGYKNATILHMDTDKAALEIEDASLDFVFIDADHTTEGVLSDIKNWTPKVKDGGYVMGHDREWPSVQRALKATYDAWESEDNNVWFVQKK